MKVPSVSSEDVVRVLKRVGFSYAPKRGKGSHLAFYKEEQGRNWDHTPKLGQEQIDEEVIEWV